MHVLDVDHLVLQTLELVLPVFQVALLVGVQNVVVPSGCEDGRLHTGFHPPAEVDVRVQVHVRPEVDQLYAVVPAADTVDTPESLDDTDGIPVDVIVDAEVAVLQVLTLRYAVRSDQDVEFFLGVLVHQIPALRYRREPCQGVVEIPLDLLQGVPAVHRSRDLGGVESVILLELLGYVLVEVVGGIAEGSEDQNLPVTRVYGVVYLVQDASLERGELLVVRRCDAGDRFRQLPEDCTVVLQIVLPLDVVHVLQADLDVVLYRIDLVVFFELRQVLAHLDGLLPVLELLYVGQCLLDPGEDLVHGLPERIDGTLQTLEEVDGGEPPDSLLTPGTVDCRPVDAVLVLLAGEDEIRRDIHLQVQPLQGGVDALEGHAQVIIRDARVQVDRFQTLRELPDLVHAVVLLDVLPGTCDGHAVQDLEEVEVETVQQILRGAFLGFKGAPSVEGLLGIPEYRIQRAADVEVVLHQARLALVGDHQLVVEVVEPVVHRRGRQHQDLRLGAGPDDLV